MYLYVGLLTFLSFYGLHRLIIIYLYFRYKKNFEHPEYTFVDLPVVTIQLPFYNERYVAERAIDKAAAIEYPMDRLEIQVLDDSTDDTARIAAARVDYYRGKGLDIHYIHREDRAGFKAGALENGMKKAKGEFFAIFDADFVPDRDFLNNSIHYFTNPRIGMVQLRWGHINRDYSFLTALEAIFLDGHFMIEHTARNRSGRFFNFNGTAGIWRRQAILESGGWQHDTLTEDLDLSYRAQLKGWKFVFVPEHEVPAELPVDMLAFKTQQHRWTKGSIQTCKKLLTTILRSDYPFRVKSEAFFHLAANFNYLLMIPLSVMIFPIALVRKSMGYENLLILDIFYFIMIIFSISAFFMVSQKEISKNWLGKIRYIPGLMALGIGLSVTNSLAVLEAIFNHKSSFIRTPKIGTGGKGEKHTRIGYRTKYITAVPIIEFLFGLYFSFAVIVAATEELWFSIPFLMLFQFGYMITAIMSFHTMSAQRR